MIKRKAKVFFNEKTIVHIILNNTSFYNGLLFKVTDDYLIIHDRVEGRKQLFLFDIKNIEEFKEVGE